MRKILRGIRRVIVPDGVWQVAVRRCYRIVGAWRQILSDGRIIGVRQRLQLQRDRRASRGVRAIKLAGYDYPLFYRSGTSDANVILQVFADREYGCVANEPKVRSIVDCGGNIGCTSFYFLHRYPESMVVVVEPDAENMSLCRRNLAPFSDRVKFVQAGVWSRSAEMVVERGGYRDGQPWAFQVREVHGDESPDFTAVTIPDLLRIGAFTDVDILKVDIEAAEKEVFCDAEWVKDVRILVIETHGDECQVAVESACAGYLIKSGMSGELSVYRRCASVFEEGVQ